MSTADPRQTRGSHESVAVILGTHPFPHGNSSANRMLSLAQTFAAAGFSAMVVNDDPRLTSGHTSPAWDETRGVRYANLGHSHGSKWSRMRRRRSFPERAVGALDRVAAQVRVVVIPSGIWAPHLRSALRAAVPDAQLVVDVVERHDATQFQRGRLDTYFLRHRLTSWYALRTAGRIISISSALANGPLSSRSALVLPPAVDAGEFAEAASRERPHDLVRITYFGSPGAKDDLAAALRAIRLLPAAARAELRFAIAGVEKSQLAALPGVSDGLLEDVQDTLEIVGSLPREELLALLSRTHFSILLRDPEAGFALYGFPSKVPESLAAGCPVVGNLTSDLDRYLSDGVNALICDGTDADVATAMERAVGLVASGSYEAMSGAARATALERLTPDAWASEVAAEFAG